jgi:predicted metalloprotease with PDZ domain
MLAILTVILLFVFLVIPAKKELEANKAERDRWNESDDRQIALRLDYFDRSASRGFSSVDDFETDFCRARQTAERRFTSASTV